MEWRVLAAERIAIPPRPARDSARDAIQTVEPISPGTPAIAAIAMQGFLWQTRLRIESTNRPCGRESRGERWASLISVDGDEGSWLDYGIILGMFHGVAS